MNAVTLVQMSSGSRIAVELNGNTAGTQYDQLNLGTAGSISLNGNAWSFLHWATLRHSGPAVMP